MNQDQTYYKCEYYDSDKRLHIDNEVMKNFIGNIIVNEQVGTNYETKTSTTEDVNKLCSTCNSFKNIFSFE